MEKKQTVGQKVKGHFKRNKKVYAGIGIGLAVGGVGILGYKIYSDNQVNELKDEVKELKEGIDGLTAKIGDLINASTNTTGDISAAENAHIEVNMGNITNITQLVRRGHAGNIIRRLSDGEEWSSQRQLCKELGIDGRDLWRHLKGQVEDLDGEVYEKVGSFNADEQS